MAIRLRTVNGVRVALCAYETDAEPGDIYLHDGEHYALAAKFCRDWQGLLRLTKHKPKLRDDIRRYFRQRNEDTLSVEL